MFRQQLGRRRVARDVIETMVASGFHLRNVMMDFHGGIALHIAYSAYGREYERQVAARLLKALEEERDGQGEPERCSSGIG